jgi:hypothetical protein
LPLLVALSTASCGHKNSPTAPSTTTTMPMVHGSIELPGHAPAPGVMVTIDQDVTGGIAPNSAPYNDITFTDSVGAFAFTGVPAGHFFVISGIQKDPIGASLILTDSLVAATRLTITAPGSPAPPVHLTLGIPGVFKGRVLDNASGRPAEALVLANGVWGISGSDSTGNYLLPGTPPGNWQVLAVELIDSVTALTGSQPATMPGPGDTVSVPDIRVVPRVVPVANPARGSPAPPALSRTAPQATPADAAQRAAAIRERRAAILQALETRR